MSERSPVAVVTGGSAGIGWEIGRRLIGDGYHVISADIAAGSIESGSEEIIWRSLDVTDYEEVQRVFESVAEEFDGIDLLVNNAGIQRHRALEELSLAEWQTVVNVNLHGVFNCLQAAGRGMLAAGSGSIVNISSVSARGAAGRAPYATTKAAVVALTATAGAEWASRGVRVNAVAPGYVETGVLLQGVQAGTLDLDSVLARIPARRLAHASEVASVVSFLASEHASYINGQTLYVDGGFMVDFGIPLARRPE